MKTFLYSTYKNKKVLITGHTGFKGSWLTKWLLSMGAEVIGYSLAPETSPALFNILELENDIIHYVEDIRDKETLNRVVKDHKPDIVLHLAAQALVRESYNTPIETLEANVMGTANVLEAVRQNLETCSVVVVSSDKCYENKEWLYGYRENEPMGGHDPYSASKGCTELVTSSYRNSFFNPKEYGKTHKIKLASARAGNVIGGGDWAKDRIVVDCITYIQNGFPIPIRNPFAVRPWQHVLEPLSGYLLLGALMTSDDTKYCEGWNFGPNDSDVLNVGELAKTIIEIWGSGEYKVDEGNHPHEAKLLKLDISKARFSLNWKPVYSAHEAIKTTVEWYKKYHTSPSEIKEYTMRDIQNYIENAQKQNITWALEE